MTISRITFTLLLVLGTLCCLTTTARTGDKTRPRPKSVNSPTRELAYHTLEKVKNSIKAEGWQIQGTPSESGGAWIMSVKRGSAHGAVVFGDFHTEATAVGFEEAIMRNNGVVMLRDGTRVLTVLMPGRLEMAQTLFEILLKL